MKKTVLIRIDDVCTSMNAEKFNEMIDMLEAHNVKGLLGIVPMNKDTELAVSPEDALFWDRMKKMQQEGWVLAMHGVNHVYDSVDWGLVCARKKSEFAGHSFDEQYTKLKAGCGEFEKHGIVIDTFFAPGHSYDRNTVKALKKLGFIYISDGRSKGVYDYKGIRFIPCRSYGLPKVGRGVTTVALHPCAKGFDYQQFLKWFDRNKVFIENYNEFLIKNGKVEIGTLRNVFEKSSERLFVFYERKIHSKLSKLKAMLLRRR